MRAKRAWMRLGRSRAATAVHERDGVRIAYDRRPGREPLVVLHGGSGRRQQGAALVRLLSPACDVVAPDLRGHGASSHTPGRYRLDAFADDIASLCREVFGGRPVIVYGHSFGGRVALMLAARYPGLARGVIIGDAPLAPSGGVLAGEDRAVVAGWRALASAGLDRQAITSALEDMSVPDPGCPGGRRPARQVSGPGHVYLTELAASLSTHDPAFLDEMVLSPSEAGPGPALLAAFAAPVLLIRADPAAGGLLTGDQARRAQQARGNVHVAAIAGRSHALHVEDPAAVAAVINPFIERLLARQATPADPPLCPTPKAR
jgi:magnesium chelatase accessory protein